MAKTVTSDDFQAEVLDTSDVVLVDFYADWCGPCKMLEPIIEQLSQDRKDVKIGKLDVDSNQATAGQYGVSSIPTLIFFKDGKEIDRVMGFQSQEALENKFSELA